MNEPTALHPHELAAQLQALRVNGASRRYLCAVSGGADSMALLHALAQVPAINLRVIHVNHGLHPQAGNWARCVAAACAQLELALDIVEVRIDDETNVEAAARAARYSALAAALEKNESLVTAHHLDDQALTVLLQLLRGAGPAGLAAMPRSAPFGRGWHVRPLLALSCDSLLDYCRAQHLTYCDDPSNEDERFERNYLRRHLAPALRRRWPGFAATLARSAANCAEANALLRDLATLDAGDLHAVALDLNAVLTLPTERVANVVRAYVHERGAVAPNRARLLEFVRQLQTAGEDKLPSLCYDDVEARVYRGHLFVGPPPPAPPPGWRGALEVGVPLTLPAGLGVLHRHPGPEDAAPLEVSFRIGGETFGRSPSRALKTYFQARGVLPWMRASVPLLWRDGELLAIADLWRDATLEGEIEWAVSTPVVLSPAAAPGTN